MEVAEEEDVDAAEEEEEIVEVVEIFNLDPADETLVMSVWIVLCFPWLIKVDVNGEEFSPRF